MFNDEHKLKLPFFPSHRHPSQMNTLTAFITHFYLYQVTLSVRKTLIKKNKIVFGCLNPYNKMHSSQPKNEEIPLIKRRTTRRPYVQKNYSHASYTCNHSPPISNINSFNFEKLFSCSLFSRMKKLCTCTEKIRVKTPKGENGSLCTLLA